MRHGSQYLARGRPSHADTESPPIGERLPPSRRRGAGSVTPGELAGGGLQLPIPGAPCMWCRLFVPLIAATLLMTACGKGGAPGGVAATDRAALLLAAEDVRVLTFSARSEGPVVTGSVQPERRADLRAEVSSVVLQVLKDNGEPVKRGDLLVRMDDTSIRDAWRRPTRRCARSRRRSIRPSARCSV